MHRYTGSCKACQRAPQETADRLRETDTKKGCRSSIRYVWLRAQSKEPHPLRSVPMNSRQPTGSTPQQLTHEHGMLRSARNLGGGCGSGVGEGEPPKKDEGRLQRSDGSDRTQQAQPPPLGCALSRFVELDIALASFRGTRWAATPRVAERERERARKKRQELP